MSDERFSPEEQDLIRRLREEPRPQIDSAAREAIREHMIAEFRYVTATSPAPRPIFRPVPVLAAVAALVIVVVIIAQITRQPAQLVTPPTQVAIVNTDQPTNTPEPPTITPTITLPSPTPTPIQATEIVPATHTPTATDIPIIPSVPPTQETTIIVEGPVSAINGSVLTVYDLDVEVAPGHPILSLLEVGDFVRVEGAYESGGTVSASIVGNLDEVTVVDGETATVNLEGPVESIDENQVVVNGITVELDPDDPILDSLQVGSFVSVQGNFSGSGTTIVLIVVNVTVINDVEVIESDCWYHDDAMGMGHWHCDGMGMGMGDDGMGMGEAMGMGMGR
jgi:hypothetical protein